ncbi:MAG: hypothetical protein ACXW3D_00510 [Caulobacteraceae bacterium]
MKRIDQLFKALDLFGAGKHGFQDGDPANGIAATKFNASFWNNIQEELARIVEASGAALDGANYSQVLTALKQIFGGAVNVKTATGALTYADAGTVFVDAAAGNITLTIPAADRDQAFRFSRIDATANTVTVQRAGADVVDGATSFTLPTKGSSRSIVRVSAGVWRSFAAGGVEESNTVAQIHYARSGSTTTTTSTTPVGSNVSLSVTKRKSGNKIRWFGFALMQLENNLANAAAAQGYFNMSSSIDAGVNWVQFNPASPGMLVGDSLVATNPTDSQTNAIAFNSCDDNGGNRPASYLMRTELASFDGNSVKILNTALLGIEVWA